jgi:ABC-type multidrug transport system fused ATPase/permease subunit
MSSDSSSIPATGIASGPEADAPDASFERRRRKKRGNTQFWRACRFLVPYRRMVIVSVLAAVFVGAVTTGGLAVMLPILRVLINNDTVQSWVDRQIVETRFGVGLSAPTQREHAADAVVVSVAANSPADQANLAIGDTLSPVNRFATASGNITIETIRGPKQLRLPPVKWYERLGHDIAGRFPTGPVKAIGILFGLIALLTVVSNLVRFAQEYLSDKSAISAVTDIRRNLYDHVLHMPMNFFGRQGTSDVTSRIVSDPQVLQDGLKLLLGQSVQESLKAGMVFCLSLAISWKLTAFIVICAPVMAIIIRKFGKKMRRATRAALERSSAMLGQIEASLVGIRVVKSATAERFERRRYRDILHHLRREQLKMARYEAYATPTMETFSLIVVGIVLMFASYLVLVTRTLDQSRFFAVMTCLAIMGESHRRVSKVNNILQRSNAAAARIFEVLDLPIERRRDVGRGREARRGEGAEARREENEARRHEGTEARRGEEQARRHEGKKARREEADDSASSPSCLRASVPSCLPTKIPPIQREIAFENVTFAYPNTQHPAVLDVSLRVGKGTSVAIVGRNGSGKTTLLALLPRFYEPQDGRVTIDGVDVRDATLRSLRGQIGIVTQDSVIFPGTIADNIAYGLPRAPREAIIDAAKRAFCHDFIVQKPGGYDAPLDGLGGQLSGGQKQRLNIARAILRRSPILILDEATSQVDAESEHLIQQAIETLMREKSPTTFVIAHRFSTILSADTIEVMDQGRIVGQGRHDELLGNCETYKQLYERQLFAA